MAPLPRSTCPVCKERVPCRKNGALREHVDRRYAAPSGGLRKCPGSGVVLTDRRRPIWNLKR